MDDEKPPLEKLMLGVFLGALALGVHLTGRSRSGRNREKKKPERDEAQFMAAPSKHNRDAVAREMEAAKGKPNDPFRNDGGYNSKGLPPDAEYPTVRAHYFRGEGGWGPAPGLSLACRKCGHCYSAQSSSYSAPHPIPDLEETKMWMRKKCPLGEANCSV